MTEQEWLTCTYPPEMLQFIQCNGALSERKARLFAVALCRDIWHLMSDERSRRAIEVAESYADGLLSEDEKDAARDRAYELVDPAVHDQFTLEDGAAALAAYWALDGVANDVEDAATDAILFAEDVGCSPKPAQDKALTAAHVVHSDLLHDIFGNPFRQVAVNASLLSCNGGTVLQLAQVAYEERQLPSGHLDAARLAILADALEEAGCANPHNHAPSRGSGLHVRGCWVIDLLLGKK